jgi:hypothetical protein
VFYQFRPRRRGVPVAVRRAERRGPAVLGSPGAGSAAWSWSASGHGIPPMLSAASRMDCACLHVRRSEAERRGRCGRIRSCHRNHRCVRDNPSHRAPLITNALEQLACPPCARSSGDRRCVADNGGRGHNSGRPARSW